MKKTEASTDSKEESKQQVIFKMSKDDTSNSVLRAIEDEDSDDGLGEESVSPHLNTIHIKHKSFKMKDNKSTRLCCDSGASNLFVDNPEYLSNKRKTRPIRIQTGSRNAKIYTEIQGDVYLQSNVPNSTKVTKATNAMHSPNVSGNCLSMSQFDKSGY